MFVERGTLRPIGRFSFTASSLMNLNVGVNTVIGMHTIRKFHMVLDPGDNVIEARKFLHCKPFGATYESG